MDWLIDKQEKGKINNKWSERPFEITKEIRKQSKKCRNNGKIKANQKIRTGYKKRGSKRRLSLDIQQREQSNWKQF